MSFTIRRDEELFKIFNGNNYVGYVDEENDLYKFVGGAAVLIEKDVDINQALSIIERDF